MMDAMGHAVFNGSGHCHVEFTLKFDAMAHIYVPIPENSKLG